MTPLYGWGERSKRVHDYVPDARFERTSIISSLGRDGFSATFTFKGTLNKEGFEAYIQNYLVPTLQFGDVVVMDNSSVHTAKGVLQSLFDMGVKVLFLPKYSPDFNPIELAWSKMKAALRKLKARTNEALEKALLTALASITKEDITNYFSHDGYL
jgi:transposase